MTKKLFVVVLLSLFIFTGCSKDGSVSAEVPPIQNTKSYNEGPAVVFGDSIANGVGADLVSSRPESCLARISGERVLNYAQDGATSEDLVGLVNYVARLKPSVVLISLGGNDVLGEAGRITKQETFSNMTRIFRAFTRAGSLVVHLGLNPQFEGLPPELDISRLPELAGIAQQEGVVFLDSSMKGFWGNDAYMSDIIHPNDKGYQVLCDRVSEVIKPHLK